MTPTKQTTTEKTVKVTAPARIALFLAAINEPFSFRNGDFYLVRWSSTEAARQFCADNGVRPRDLEEMTFTAVECGNDIFSTK